MKTDFTKEEVRLALTTSHSKTELARKLGCSYTNATIHKWLNDLLISHALSWDLLILRVYTKKYALVVKQCPICFKDFEAQEGHHKEKQTCSYSCANKFFADFKYSFEVNEKRRNTLLSSSTEGKTIAGRNCEYIGNHRFYLTCSYCNRRFEASKSITKFCSNDCRYSSLNSEEYSEKLRQIQLKRIQDGTHVGWRSRDKINRSFPEKYFEKLLTDFGYEKGLDFKVELKQSKWFLDFAFEDRKIVIEIDGKQHEYSERKLKDQEKDTWLISNGWTVYRIKWKKVDKEYREYLISQIDTILKI